MSQMMRTAIQPDDTPAPALGQGAWREGEDRRHRITRRTFVSGASVAGLAAGVSTSSSARPGPRRGPVDHHVHLNSPAILAFLPDFCARAAQYGGCDPATTATFKPTDLLKQMDEAGVRKTLVVSTGYLAQSPVVDPPRADASTILRSANDWTVAVARRNPARFRAFVAVNPLHPDVANELGHWASDPNVAGLKIHLTSAAADLRRQEDVSKLAATFRLAARRRLPILIHLRTMRMDYGAVDVRRFLDEVIPNDAATPIQIAHAGGWGGLDAPTLEALTTFAEAIEQQPTRLGHLLFDLAGVWSAQTAPADLERLCALIRRIGITRFLPASDWPFSGALAPYYRDVYPRLPLTSAEWNVLRSNTAPYSG
jgi:predicted TIM-barrel fold metal-dependent hydrolase